jgi:RNA polymerase sigma-70 factor, ECF subfamily
MWKYSRDPQIVEELVQEVFVEAYGGLRNYHARAPFLHWLRRIATRVGYRHWKRKSRDRDRRELFEKERPAHTAQSIEEPSEAAEYVYGLLDRLPPADRMVLTLLYFEECDTHEIAQRLGWTRSLVKVRAFRARKKLKLLLEEAGYGDAGSA